MRSSPTNRPTQTPRQHATGYQFLGFTDAQIDAVIPSRNPSICRDGLDPLRFKYWQLGADGIAPFVLDLAPAEFETYARGSDDDKAITRLSYGIIPTRRRQRS
jgi:hypothetical protein